MAQLSSNVQLTASGGITESTSTSSESPTTNDAPSTTSSDSELESLYLIRVEIFDMYASSTILRVYPHTTTSYICDAISSKIDLAMDQMKYNHLILSVTWKDFLSKERYSYIYTLKQSDYVISVFSMIMDKIRTKISMDYPDIDIDEVVFIPTAHDLSAMNMDGFKGYHDKYKSVVMIRWFYKDMRTTPLDCGLHKDDVSANSSSSDDEVEMTADNMTYLGQFDRKGFLFRRSRRDPNVWRKRLCILVDHLWCINYPDRITIGSKDNGYHKPSRITRRKRPKGTCYPIGPNFKAYDSVQGFQYTHCIALQFQSNGTSQSIIFLRASSQVDQQLWISDLFKRAAVNIENQSMNMAEMIIGDESRSQSEKTYRNMNDPISSLFRFRGGLSKATIYNVVSENGHTKNRFHFYQNDEVSSQESRPTDGYENAEKILESSASAKVVSVHNPSRKIFTSKPMSIPDSESNDENDDNDPLCTSREVRRLCDDASKLPYSSESWRSLTLRVHRSPTYSMIHGLHREHPIIAQILMFLYDVNKYKQYHRLEIASSPRLLWIKLIIIFQKYLVRQLSDCMNVSQRNSNKASTINSLVVQNSAYSDIELESKVSNEVLLNVYEERNSRKSARPGQLTLFNDTDKSVHVSRKISFSESPRVSARYHLNSYEYMRSSCKCSTFGNLSWGLSTEVMLMTHKRIFTNIRRQIAGFDVPTMTVKASNPDHEERISSITVSNQVHQNTALVPLQSVQSTPISSNVPIMFSWLWGGSSAPVSDLTEERLSSMLPQAVVSDQYIRYEEIYGPFPEAETRSSSGFLSTPHSSLSRNSITSNHGRKNQPVYEIKDIHEIPSANIFDDIAEEAFQILQRNVTDHPSVRDNSLKRSNTL